MNECSSAWRLAMRKTKTKPQGNRASITRIMTWRTSAIPHAYVLSCSSLRRIRRLVLLLMLMPISGATAATYHNSYPCSTGQLIELEDFQLSFNFNDNTNRDETEAIIGKSIESRLLEETIEYAVMNDANFTTQHALLFNTISTAADTSTNVTLIGINFARLQLLNTTTATNHAPTVYFHGGDAQFIRKCDLNDTAATDTNGYRALQQQLPSTHTMTMIIMQSIRSEASEIINQLRLMTNTTIMIEQNNNNDTNTLTLSPSSPTLFLTHGKTAAPSSVPTSSISSKPKKNSMHHSTNSPTPYGKATAPFSVPSISSTPKKKSVTNSTNSPSIFSTHGKATAPSSVPSISTKPKKNSVTNSTISNLIPSLRPTSLQKEPTRIITPNSQPATFVKAPRKPSITGSTSSVVKKPAPKPGGNTLTKPSKTTTTNNSISRSNTTTAAASPTTAHSNNTQHYANHNPTSTANISIIAGGPSPSSSHVLVPTIILMNETTIATVGSNGSSSRSENNNATAVQTSGSSSFGYPLMFVIGLVLFGIFGVMLFAFFNKRGSSSSPKTSYGPKSPKSKKKIPSCYKNCTSKSTAKAAKKVHHPFSPHFVLPPNNNNTNNNSKSAGTTSNRMLMAAASMNSRKSSVEKPDLDNYISMHSESDVSLDDVDLHSLQSASVVFQTHPDWDPNEDEDEDEELNEILGQNVNSNLFVVSSLTGTTKNHYSTTATSMEKRRGLSPPHQLQNQSRMGLEQQQQEQPKMGIPRGLSPPHMREEQGGTNNSNNKKGKTLVQSSSNSSDEPLITNTNATSPKFNIFASKKSSPSSPNSTSSPKYLAAFASKKQQNNKKQQEEIEWELSSNNNFQTLSAYEMDLIEPDAQSFDVVFM